MAKDNFWKNPAVRKALVMLAKREGSDLNTSNMSDAADELLLGELFKSDKTRAMLGPTGVRYPSELDFDLLREGNAEWYNPFDTGTMLDAIYRASATNEGTLDSFKNRLIGMTKRDPRLNEIVFNKDGSINQANVDRIARIAYAKLSRNPLNNDPENFYITSNMSEDEAAFRAERAEDLLGNNPDFIDNKLNGSGALLALNDRVIREYNPKQQQDASKLLEAARAGSLANNDVEATIGGDPVSVLPSYVQASYEKTPEDELEEQLLKRKLDDKDFMERGSKYVQERFNKNKQNLAWWL
jgi:hypothetical protein